MTTKQLPSLVVIDLASYCFSCFSVTSSSFATVGKTGLGLSVGCIFEKACDLNGLVAGGWQFFLNLRLEDHKFNLS